MGVCLTSKKSKYAFDMGYGGFQSLRTNIAKVWDSELGEAYADTLINLNKNSLSFVRGMNCCFLLP